MPSFAVQIECMENNEVRILRRDLDIISRTSVPIVSTSVLTAKTLGRYGDVTTTHLDTCPKVKVSCSNEFHISMFFLL